MTARSASAVPGVSSIERLLQGRSGKEAKGFSLLCRANPVAKDKSKNETIKATAPLATACLIVASLLSSPAIADALNRLDLILVMP